MRNWKLALVAAALVAPLGTLSAVSDDATVSRAIATPGVTSVADKNGQDWACCWVFFMGRWMCVPC